jgi:hypothetical protein
MYQCEADEYCNFIKKYAQNSGVLNIAFIVGLVPLESKWD